MEAFYRLRRWHQRMTELSVLDLATIATGSSPAQALRESTDLAIASEELGFKRFWVAEHHGMPAVASSSPPVLIAHLAARTSTIRVGSGGVMLPNHAPLVVAEQFATLEALYPQRIDLGLGRAPGTDQRTMRALRRNSALNAEEFPNDVVELYNYFVGSPESPRVPAAVPGVGYLPQLWLLGSSLYSAQLAGVLGYPFAFAYHFSPGPLDAAIAAYRNAFTPSSVLEEPHVMVAVSVICAPTNEEAKWLSGASALSILQLHSGRLGPMPSPKEAEAYDFTSAERSYLDSVLSTHIIGDPVHVSNGLSELVERTGADELILSTRIHGFDDRLRPLQLVATNNLEVRV